MAISEESGSHSWKFGVLSWERPWKFCLELQASWSWFLLSEGALSLVFPPLQFLELLLSLLSSISEEGLHVFWTLLFPHHVCWVSEKPSGPAWNSEFFVFTTFSTRRWKLKHLDTLSFIAFTSAKLSDWWYKLFHVLCHYSWIWVCINEMSPASEITH